MDENTTALTEDSWDDIDASDIADDDDEQQEPEPAQEDEAPPAEDAAAAQEDTPPAPAVETPASEPQPTVSQADYDALRSELDAIRADGGDETLAFLRELAAAQGVSVNEIVDRTRAAMLIQTEGLEPDAAMERVALERRERDIRIREQRIAAEQAQQARAQEETQRRNADFKAVIDAYPELDPKSIPQEVWKDVAGGFTLLSAYTKYENAQLKQQLAQQTAAIRQNKDNAERSTGSRASSGGSQSEIDTAWDEDDY